MKGVRLLGRWGEAVPKHDGDEALDALRRALDPKVEGLGWGKCLSEDHHCLHVGVRKGLTNRKRSQAELGSHFKLTQPPMITKQQLQATSKVTIWFMNIESPAWPLQTKVILFETKIKTIKQSSRNLSPWLQSLSGIWDPLIWRELWLDPPQMLRAPPEKTTTQIRNNNLYL